MEPRHKVARSRQPAPTLALVRTVSLYRYFSFMAALALMVAWPSARGAILPLADLVSLGLVGVYVALGVVLPLHPRSEGLRGYGLLALDLGLGLGALLATGGLDSGLLPYSLAPVLAASLFLEQRAAVAAASIFALALLGAHLTGGTFSWLLSENTLAIFLIYTIAAGLVAVVPYYANLNLRRRLEIEATAGERRRLRRDIHDSLAQEVGFLNMRAKQLHDLTAGQSAGEVGAGLAELQQALQKTYTNIRVYLDVLSLPADVSLASALAELARDFSARTGIALEASLAPGRLDLSAADEVQFLAVAQEALANVHKHARASRARLALTSSGSTVEMLVEDAGQGFNPESACPPGHYGLVGMRERAQQIGAVLTITSRPGGGTQVRLTLQRRPQLARGSPPP